MSFVYLASAVSKIEIGTVQRKHWVLEHQMHQYLQKSRCYSVILSLSLFEICDATCSIHGNPAIVMSISDNHSYCSARLK